MSFLTKIAILVPKEGAGTFESDQVLISKLITNTNPAFDRVYHIVDGKVTPLYLEADQEMPEGAYKVPTVGIQFHVKTGYDAVSGKMEFEKESRPVYLPVSAFANWIEEPRSENYHDRIGALAVLEGLETISQHKVGNLDVGSEYTKVTGVIYHASNKTITHNPHKNSNARF